MLTIYKHELNVHSHSLSSYIFITFILLAVGIFSLMYNLNNSVANFEYVMSLISMVLVIAVPIITMRTISEERKQRTDQLLYTLPLSMTEIVMGKFLAILTVYAIPLVLICAYPIIFKQFGDVYLITSFGTIIAFFFLGAAFIAMGMFISSLTENQGVSAGITIIVLIVNYLIVTLANVTSTTAMGSLIALTVLNAIVCVIIRAFTKSTPVSVVIGLIFEVAIAIVYLINDKLFVGLVPAIMKKLSLFERYYVFANGIFDITAIIYFASFAAFFIFLTVQSLEKRRYS